jgi:predicted dithiol-disulfide oxidoreductase (DUF899 family)
MNFIYTNYFFEKDLQKYSDVINRVRAIPDDADIIYIGESSNNTFRANDIDKRPISSFVADFFPDLKVYDITKAASHAGIYKTLLSKIPESQKKKTIVVTLNLRSFNAQWIYSKLETPLRKSMVLLQDYPPLVNRFLLSFKAYDIKSDAERDLQFKRQWEMDEFRFPYSFRFNNVIEWDYWMAHNGIKDTLGNVDKAKTELASHYIKAYAFQIDTNTNPRFSDFNEIIQLAKERGWNLVFNLLAENTQKAGELVGKDLVFLMEENRKLLIDYFSGRGQIVVDNFYVVDDDQFVDQNWTTEHYAEKGRKTVARNVAVELRNFYPDAFEDVAYNRAAQTSFFNDCEKTVIWGQMHTLSDENAFSGRYASKTGKGNEYSITFEYPFQSIPDTARNTIQIECKLWMQSTDIDAKLVIQAKGDKMEEYWYGELLSNHVHQTHSWEDFQLNFQIPDKIKQADLVKIYVFNVSNKTVLLDDFKIEFR